MEARVPSATRAALRIVAAGGLVWREFDDGPRLAVVHRPRHRDWTLPKGKLQAAEDPETAALREVLEETGWDAEIVAWAGSLSYSVDGWPKLVLFWHMTALHGSFEPGDEVIDLAWLTNAEALEQLDHARERELVARAT